MQTTERHIETIAHRGLVLSALALFLIMLGPVGDCAAVKMDPSRLNIPAGRLFIKAEPTGARIVILNATPKYAPGVELAQGTYSVKASMEGYEPKTVKISVEAGKDNVYALTLTPLKTTLTVVADPPDAVVTILSPKTEYHPGVELKPGEYEIQVEKQGFDKAVERFAVVENRDNKLELSLAKATGGLTVSASPEDAAVVFVGSDLKYEPGMELKPGRYSLEASKDGYVTKGFSVGIKKGESVNAKVKLKPKPKHSTGRVWREPETGMEFLWVPGGCFKMGCGPWAGVCDRDEKPVREVCVDGFWLAKYETTQAEWSKIMGDNPSSFKGEKLPVETISWRDAVSFAEKLSAKSKARFRLPTEAEWEYACRSGGLEQKYCGGNDLSSLAWILKNSGGKTNPVGGKTPNGFGLFDMSGNVYEFCRDWFGGYGFISGHVRNPLGPDNGAYRINRGGGWLSNDNAARSINRYKGLPGARSYDLGVRLLKEE